MTGRRNVQPEETLVYREVGRRIRIARLRRGMNQQQLAELVDLNRTSVTNIENGNQTLTLAGFLNFADALDTDWADLLANQVERLQQFEQAIRDANNNTDPMLVAEAVADAIHTLDRDMAQDEGEQP